MYNLPSSRWQEARCLREVVVVRELTVLSRIHFEQLDNDALLIIILNNNKNKLKKHLKKCLHARPQLYKS